MITKPTKKELIIHYLLSNPISAREILFSDLGNLVEWNKDKFSQVRKYQYNMCSFDTLYLPDKNKTEKENFEIRRGLAESFIFGGRLTGKSLISIITDVPIVVIKKGIKKAVIDTFDKLHLKGIFEEIFAIFENHPIFSFWLNKKGSIKSPDYNLNFKNLVNVKSVNNKEEGKSKGSQWYSKHVDRDWGEESQALTEEVSKKKFMAKAEIGMIQRLSGITEFNPFSPIGKIFNKLENKSKVINLPSYVNPTFTDQDEKEAIDEFNGKESAGFLVQILGKVINSTENPLDLEKIRECYDNNLILKTFEITKDNFHNYKNILILERLNNAENLGIYMDIGEGAAPTEIIVIQKIKKLRYTHNITANKITPDELYELIRYIIEKMQPNIIGYDYGSGVAKALHSNLSKDYPKNLIPVGFNEKTIIDYKKDKKTKEYERDNKNGNLIPITERVDIWSFHRIKHIFYNHLIEMPEDYKFDKQVQNVVLIDGKYQCKVANHLLQAFQVMAISEWIEDIDKLEPIESDKPSAGISGEI